MQDLIYVVLRYTRWPKHVYQLPINVICFEIKYSTSTYWCSVYVHIILAKYCRCQQLFFVFSSSLWPTIHGVGYPLPPQAIAWSILENTSSKFIRRNLYVLLPTVPPALHKKPQSPHHWNRLYCTSILIKRAALLQACVF